MDAHFRFVSALGCYRHVVCESLGLDTTLVRSWDVMYAVLGVDTRSASYRGCLDFVDAVVCSAELF